MGALFKLPGCGITGKEKRPGCSASAFLHLELHFAPGAFASPASAFAPPPSFGFSQSEPSGGTYDTSPFHRFQLLKIRQQVQMQLLCPAPFDQPYSSRPQPLAGGAPFLPLFVTLRLPVLPSAPEVPAPELKKLDLKWNFKQLNLT